MAKESARGVFESDTQAIRMMLGQIEEAASLDFGVEEGETHWAHVGTLKDIRYRLAGILENLGSAGMIPS